MTGRKADHRLIDHRSRDLGVLALAVLPLLWGYNFVVMKVGLQFAQPFTFAALRTFLGALSLFALLIVMRRDLRPPPLLWTIAIGLLQTTGFVGLLMWALEDGGAGKTSVLIYTMPFWLLVLAWVFLGERLRGAQWLAVALALVGLVLVIEPWQLQGTLSSLLAVAGGLCWAASAVVIKRFQAGHDVGILSLTTWQMLVGALPLVAIAALTWQGSPEWTTPFVLAVSYNVIIGNALAWLLWLYGLRQLSAGAAGIATMAIPVTGVVFAWIQLGERPSTAEAAGMALIIGALAVVAGRGLAAGRSRMTREDGAEATPQE